MNARLQALYILKDVVIHDKSLSLVLDTLSHTEKPFIQALCYGVCRHFHQLSFILEQLLQKPLKAKDKDIELIIIMGFYQLLDMQVPDHAAVAETVKLVKKIKKLWAVKLTNALLRQFIRDKEQLLEKIKTSDVASYSHPKWFIDKVKKSYPRHYDAILKENNKKPPMNLRVNLDKLSRDDYIKQLNKPINIFPYNLAGLSLKEAMPVEQLPGFSEGLVSVQDFAAQLAAELLPIDANSTILDACAAPGGKTAHLVETYQHYSQLTAIEIHGERAKKITENLQRLNYNDKVTLKVADANNIESWWNNTPFDCILLDAPCSATGVIRRNPDIKIHRKPSHINAIKTLQLELLSQLWHTLKSGAYLLYVTCSVLEEENAQVIEKFLSTHTTAHHEPIDAPWGIEQKFGRQILPGSDNMDGFYYCLLKKV